MPFQTAIILIVVAVVVSAVVFGAIAFRLGVSHRKKIAEATMGSAEEEAKRIVSEAIKDAEAKKKESLVEAKDEIHRLRNEADKEIRDRRSEVQRQERRIHQKEESLDRKMENLEKKDETLNQKIHDAEERLSEVEGIKRSQFEMLERISGFTTEQAKEYLLKALEDELIHEKSVKVMEIEQQTKEEADKRARELVSQAIQRCAADHVAEATVSVVTLPNEEMKGRIIGREGRNIRTLETLTGVDLIIDDTPEAITLSSFDPIRRETARIALERLIADGRIHPARIEEMVEKAKREIDATIKAEGERAVIETGVHGMHIELVKLLGRLRYRTSYGQNVLKHSLEVAYLAGIMASELGEDPTLARRAGLLHDIGKALDHEMEGSHIELGVEVARRYKESEAVIHAIHAHHGDVEAKTVIACLVQAADAISAARPGARRENLENYIKRLEKLEEIACSFDGVERSYAIQAGREIRIMVKPEIVGDDRMVLIARDIVKKIENELDYPGQIKVHLIRESRAIEYAK
ncbi:ribonuclease Y [Solibaculum mannosilyticum]|uniref:Ribonuclease Y n=1 Tax=Solibaculum mannosilyticum TaxID=2780922 RepID=A0A7I8D216_9FIRM|nr:ribonuclease Y [Solibaculum mannosilyticum]MCO7136169.1 ribonuclease Y [[Clostridium] leptum]BCI59742.1 ribonuclease Y [Solibaculum mannosilyticum]CZT56327.1 Ribonuclease Y [Eubacteriaceae bacterium CHKCI005]